MSFKRLSTGFAALAAMGALALTGCSSAHTTSAPSAGASSSASSTHVSGELNVFAAASLTQPFNEIAQAFGRKYPDVKLKPITYDGSSTLATQINQGAPVDVFASADGKNMDKVTEAHTNADQPQVFTTNVMQIAVAPGNPGSIHGLDDLAKPERKVVLCAEQVPCGNASHTLLTKAGVNLTPVSEEQNVKAVLTKVENGEADAGLVYVTDVKGSDGKVAGVDIKNADDALNKYYVAEIKGSKNPDAAKAFEDFVLSKEGQDILHRYGFGEHAK